MSRPNAKVGDTGTAFGFPITVTAVDESDDRATIKHEDGSETDVWLSAATTYVHGRPTTAEEA